MSELKVADFSWLLQGISGARRKNITSGIAYRIKTNTSKEAIESYIKDELKNSPVIDYSPKIEAQSSVREPRSEDIPREKIDAVIKEMMSIQTSEFVSNSGVMIDMKPRSMPTPSELKMDPKIGWYDRAVSVKQHSLYIVARFAIYFVVIAISLQPIHDFFKSLSLFGGNDSINAGVAVVIAIAVDLIAMDLFSRSVIKIFEKKWKKGFALLLPSLLIIAVNVHLTRENLTEKSNIRVNLKTEKAWEKAIKKAEIAKKSAEKEYAVARGKFLSVKWKGSSSVEDCESGKVSCRGPFSSHASEYQSAFLEAETLLSSAKVDLEKVENQKPVLSDSSGTDATAKRVLVYMTLWACILATYVYEPRRDFVS